MTTLADIRAAWSEKVFAHDSIQAITPNVWAFDVTLNSQKEAERIYYQSKVNYIQYTVTGTPSTRIGGRVDWEYQVTVRVIRWCDPKGDNYNAILDTIEILQGLSITALGPTWDSTVSDSRPDDAAPSIETIYINDVPCYRGTYAFIGNKFSN